MNWITRNFTNLLKNFSNTSLINLNHGIHSTSVVQSKWNKHNTGPKKFLQYNKQIFPPQSLDEEPRKAVSLFCIVSFVIH